MNQKEVVNPSHPSIQLNDDIIKLFTDVITFDVIEDACLTRCGHSFSRNTISNWLTSNTTCPICKAQIASSSLISDPSLKILIAEFTRQNTFETKVLYVNNDIKALLLKPVTKTFIDKPVITTCCGKLYDAQQAVTNILSQPCCENSSKTLVVHYALKQLFEEIRKQLRDNNIVIDKIYVVGRDELYKNLDWNIRTNNYDTAQGILAEIYHVFGDREIEFLAKCCERTECQEAVCVLIINSLAFKLIEAGNTKFIMSLIEGAPHSVDHVIDGKTMLHKATKCQKLDLMQFLIQYGADINKTYEKHIIGLTALMLACDENFYEGAKLLLQSGADVNVVMPGQRNIRAIFIAIGKNNPDTVNLLLNSKNIRLDVEYEGLTPLQYAITRKHTDIVQILINRHVGVNAKSTSGTTALHMAVSCGYKDVVAMLLKYPYIDLDIKDKQGLTAIELASSQDNLEIYALFTDVTVSYAKTRNYLSNNECSKASSHLQQVYHDFHGETLSSHLNIVATEYHHYYQKISEDLLQTISEKIIAKGDDDIFLKLILAAKKDFATLARQLFSKQAFSHLALVLAVTVEIKDKVLMEWLRPKKAILCQKFIEQLCILMTKDAQLAERLSLNTINLGNTLGKLINTTMFDVKVSKNLQKLLIENHEGHFQKDENTISVRA